MIHLTVTTAGQRFNVDCGVENHGGDIQLRGNIEVGNQANFGFREVITRAEAIKLRDELEEALLEGFTGNAYNLAELVG